MRNWINLFESRDVTLDEARSNAPLNSTNRRSDGISKLLQYANQGGYYATFTSIPKVGVNPNSKYSTPVGIYAYPLGDGEIIEQIENNDLPFAGDQPFINVFKVVAPDEKFIGLQDDAASFQSLNTATAKWLANRLVIYRDLSGPEQNQRMGPEMLEKFIWQYVYAWVSENALSKTPGGIWWGFTRVAAALIRYTDDMKTATFKVRDLVTLCNTSIALNNSGDIKAAAPLWTRLMRDIGVDGVVDYSGGIIHGNEPTQAVFFTTSALKLVDRIDNPRQQIGRIQVGTAQQFYRALAKTVTSYNNSTVVKMLDWIAAPDGPDALFNLSAVHPVTQKAESIKVALALHEPAENFFKAAGMLARSSKISEYQRGHILTTIAYKVSHCMYVGDKKTALMWFNYGNLILGNEDKAREYWLLHLDEHDATKSMKMYDALMGRKTPTD